MKMSKWTIEKIADAKEKGRGKRWENEHDAPVSPICATSIWACPILKCSNLMNIGSIV